MSSPAKVELAVILAAGGGARMGQAKGLLRRGDATLLERHIEALAPHASEVCVVIGARAMAHRRLLSSWPVRVVLNPRWAESWPADSLHLALRNTEAGRVLVQPVDTPPAHLATVLALLQSGAPAVPTDPRGRPGHPVLLDPQIAAIVRAAAPAGGLRTLLDGAARVSVAQADVALDFDTPEAWRAWNAASG